MYTTFYAPRYTLYFGGPCLNWMLIWCLQWHVTTNSFFQNNNQAQVLSFNSQSKRDYLGDSSLDTSYAGNRPSGSFRSSFAPNQSVRGGHPGLSFSFNAFTVPKLKQRPNTNKRHAAAAVNISTAARPAKRPVYATVIRPGNSTPRIASARSSTATSTNLSFFLDFQLCTTRVV